MRYNTQLVSISPQFPRRLKITRLLPTVCRVDLVWCAKVTYQMLDRLLVNSHSAYIFPPLVMTSYFVPAIFLSKAYQLVV